MDYVTGFCIDATTGKTMIATQDLDESGKRVTGSSFYDVDTKSGASTLKGTLPRTGGESDPSFYAGYHRTCDGQGARRLGYKSVVFQENPGMGLRLFWCHREHRFGGFGFHGVEQPLLLKYFFEFFCRFSRG